MYFCGVIRIIYNGKHLYLYNHNNSELLGVSLIKELIVLLEQYSIDEMKDMFEKLIIVTPDGRQPTDNEFINLDKYSKSNVSQEIFDEWCYDSNDITSKKRWYSLLHKCQGSILLTLESGYALHNDPYADNYYEYKIDLDRKKFNKYNLVLDDLIELYDTAKYLNAVDFTENYLYAKIIDIDYDDC